MPLEHARGDRVDGRAVGDVALLVLVGARRAAREADDVRAARLQRTYQLRPDARARTRDDRYLQTRTVRPAVARCPAASTTVAIRWWLPFFSRFVFHATE